MSKATAQDARVARFQPRREAIVTHNGEWGVLLTRVGHRLWAKYKEALKMRNSCEAVVMLAACESVWDAKREYRAQCQLMYKTLKRQMSEAAECVSIIAGGEDA